MERYFPVVAKSSFLKSTNNDTKHTTRTPKFHPYNRIESDTPKLSSTQPHLHSGRFWEPLQDGTVGGLSDSALTKHILKTLSDESNPITHSDIVTRTEHVYSTSTGHQVGEGRGHLQFVGIDKEKRKTQLSAVTADSGGDSRILRGVRAYINGYLENTTDLEMKRVITQVGGEILFTASGCTHIISSQHQSGSKTHKLLGAKARNRVHVVKPEWVFDSIKSGKKLNERRYAILEDKSVENLYEMFNKRSGV